MKKIYIIIIIMIGLATFIGCENEIITPNDTDVNTNESIQNNDLNYVYDGQTIDPATINLEKEGMNIFYGFDETKNVYVFNSDTEMIEWLKVNNTERANEVLNVLQDIETATKYGELMGEFEKEEPSKEFEAYLQSNFSTQTKGLGNFYHNTNLSGTSFLISPFPKRKLNSSNDNKVSSLMYFGNTMRMSSDKNWNGTHYWVFTATFIRLGYLGTFDNQLSSYWNW